MTPTEIPEEVKERIEAEAEKLEELTPNERFCFREGAEWLYCEMSTTPHIIHPERTKTNQSGQGKKITNQQY